MTLSNSQAFVMLIPVRFPMTYLASSKESKSSLNPLLGRTVSLISLQISKTPKDTASKSSVVWTGIGCQFRPGFQVSFFVGGNNPARRARALATVLLSFPAMNLCSIGLYFPIKSPYCFLKLIPKLYSCWIPVWKNWIKNPKQNRKPPMSILQDLEWNYPGYEDPRSETSDSSLGFFVHVYWTAIKFILRNAQVGYHLTSIKLIDHSIIKTHN